MGREHIPAIVGDWSLLRGKERRAVREGWVELGGRPPRSSQITKSQGRKNLTRLLIYNWPARILYDLPRPASSRQPCLILL